ncbi:MAG TPA: winged helix DNA-binding domain-containing protein [Aquihabitans sp.]|nr:winged helix DNA-binding domain-containing protein [Aquihabitans sp.]
MTTTPSASLTAADARRLRLASLLLDDPAAERSPLDVARWMGALQAQDLASVQWSFGVRSLGATLAEVDGAFERGEVLRTWPIRGTVHAIAAEDARWMLELCGVRALQGVEKRWERLGLDRTTVEAAATLLGEALAGGRRLTRSACVERLVDAGLHTASGHGYHLLWYASQIGVTCIGPNEGKEQTFVRLDEWAPEQRSLDGDEALAVLAERFVRGRGPVTRQDLAGWAGITQGAAKTGIAAAGDALAAVDVDGTEMVAAAELLDRADEVLGAHDPKRAWLLPGFDELVLGVKDRALFLEPGHLDRIVPGSNGMFLATVVVDGRVIGTWKRTLRKTSVAIEVELFETVTKAVRASVEAAGAGYGAFHGLEPKVQIASP